MARLTIIIKPTLGCNLGCRYCYATPRPHGSMSLETLDAALSQAATVDATPIRLIWHGGEPLAVGVEFYQRAVERQAELERLSGTRFENYMQTNGTLVTRELAEFLAAHRFAVGVSLDGPPELHDRYRVTVNQHGSYQRALLGFRVLRDAGLSVGVLAVVTPETLEQVEAMADWIVDLGLSGISFNLRFDLQPQLADHAFRHHYMEFLVGVEERCRVHGHEVVIRELLRARQARGRGKSLPLLESCGAQRPCFYDHTCILPDGSIYLACDRFAGGTSQERARFRLGSVWEDGLAVALQGTVIEEAAGAWRSAKHFCATLCESRDHCQGPCPAEWFLGGPRDMSRSVPPHVACTAGALPACVDCAGVSHARS